MAIGQRFISPHYPYLPVRVRVGPRTLEVEALLDTGYDGAIVLPAALLSNGVAPSDQLRVTLADGSTRLAPIYTGILQIGQLEPFAVDVMVLGNEPMIGLGAISRYYVGLDRGQRVIVEP